LPSGAQRGRVGKTGHGFRLPRRREQAEAELVQIRISILRDDYTTCLKIKKLNKQNAGMPLLRRAILSQQICLFRVSFLHGTISRCLPAATYTGQRTISVAWRMPIRDNVRSFLIA
jgi:hypothetical protein